jgi:hypothetical protein
MKNDQTITTDALRSLVRQALGDALRGRDLSKPSTERVRITSDAELRAFVGRIIELLDDPAKAEDLRRGLIGFTLAVDGPAIEREKKAPSSTEVIRLEGVVTEKRLLAAQLRPGTVIQLTNSAVATPSARDKARRLGITFQRG